MRLDYLLIFYGFHYNRQGLDLNMEFSRRGMKSKLLTFGDKSYNNVISMKCLQTNTSFLSKFYVLLNVMHFIIKGLKYKPQNIVAYNKISLQIALIFGLINRSRIFYYALEFERLNAVNKYILKKFCLGIINVEENRQRILKDQIGWNKHEVVFYNMPHQINYSDIQPKLRKWLHANHSISKETRIIIYSGTDQRYSNLENIISWTKELSIDIILVLMLPVISLRIRNLVDNRVILLPSQPPEEVINWLCEADIALLPYEGNDIAVKYCSPQKLFDSMAAGVPIIGSNRPIIKKVLREFQFGITCDFTCKEAYLNAIQSFLSRPIEDFKMEARRGHRYYNYESQFPKLLKFFSIDNDLN